jgi:hypothetical protein
LKKSGIHRWSSFDIPHLFKTHTVGNSISITAIFLTLAKMDENSNEGTPLTSGLDVSYGNGGNETMLTDKNNGNGGGNVDDGRGDVDSDAKPFEEGNSQDGKTPSKRTKKGVKLNARNAQQLEYQVQINLIKHSLAADYFEWHQYYKFTLPQAVLTATSSVLAFSATAAMFEAFSDIISLVVGFNSAFVVLLQTISGIRNYGMRADRHRCVAVQLRDLRDDIVLMKFKLNSVERDTKQKYEILRRKDDNEEGKIGSWNDSEEQKEHEEGEDADDGQTETFDSIQKRYQQCLSGCTSNVPIELSEAFHGLASNLEIAETKENVKRMHKIYGHLNYHSLVTGKAYDILAGQILNQWNFPMSLPSSIEVVERTMLLLKGRLITAQALYDELEPPKLESGKEASIFTIFSGQNM